MKTLFFFCEKPYQTWHTAVKTFKKKKKNAPGRTRKKIQILLYRFLDEYT